jgi:hypothetical protein
MAESSLKAREVIAGDGHIFNISEDCCLWVTCDKITGNLHRSIRGGIMILTLHEQVHLP